MLKISIPKPCHQDWNKMLPQQQGRFCDSCAKTVVDFTLMNDEDVKNYLIENAGIKTCGRFNSTQVHRIKIDLPENILYIPMPYWKRFLTASLIIFSTTLFSCDTNYDTVASKNQISQTIYLADTTPAKNYLPPPPIVGKIKMPDSIPVKKECYQTMGMIALPPVKILRPVAEKLMGDISILPEKKDTIIKKIPDPIIGTSVIIDPTYIKQKVTKLNIDTIKVKKNNYEVVGEIKLMDPKITNKPKPEPCDKNIYQ